MCGAGRDQLFFKLPVVDQAQQPDIVIDTIFALPRQPFATVFRLQGIHDIPQPDFILENIGDVHPERVVLHGSPAEVL